MKYTCPCCGYKTFYNPPGSDEVCEICYWHDDLSQLRFVKETGANKIPLVDAQKNFQEFGAKEKRVMKFVRKPTPPDTKDQEWRPVDFSKDKIEETKVGTDYGLTYPDDPTKLYYWK